MWVHFRRYDSGEVHCVDLNFERDRRKSFFNWLARVFCPYITGISIAYEGSVFTCTYYDYRYFQYAEDIKAAYYEKLYAGFSNVSLVVIGRAS